MKILEVLGWGDADVEIIEKTVGKLNMAEKFGHLETGRYTIWEDGQIKDPYFEHENEELECVEFDVYEKDITKDTLEWTKRLMDTEYRNIYDITKEVV